MNAACRAAMRSYELLVRAALPRLSNRRAAIRHLTPVSRSRPSRAHAFLTVAWAAVCTVGSGACAGARRGLTPGAASLQIAPVPTASVPHGHVVTNTVWSPALGVRKQFVVYLPPSYDHDPARRYPVAYYLHGLGENEWDWVRRGGLAIVADSLAARGAGEAIVVMPDGDDGWYTTWNALGNYNACRRDTTREEPAASYCVPWPHYDDYIAHDLVARIDSLYRTRADAVHRAVAGFSMGGYGAVTLALRYPDVFGAAVSHSGVLSPLYVGPTPYAPPARYASRADDFHRLWSAASLTRQLAFGSDTAGWWARDPGRLAAWLQRTDPARLPALYADVGRDDPLADENRAFRDQLGAIGVPLAYHEWLGGHTWTYWRAHVSDGLAWLLARFPR